MQGVSVDQTEIDRFGRAAEHWWDPKGPLAPLHAMQPIRLDFIREQLIGGLGLDPAGRRPLEGQRLADIGCGGGLATEPMARLGADAVGLDPSEDAIRVARAHAEAQGLVIDYRAMPAEAVAEQVKTGAEPAFDALLALEVVEHAADRPVLLGAIADMLRPGGLVILTTLNRTAQSFLGAIVMAEYALRWLEPGTHDWRKFPTPEELSAECAGAGLKVVDRMGFAYEPLSRLWRRTPGDLSTNYALVAEKPF